MFAFETGVMPVVSLGVSSFAFGVALTNFLWIVFSDRERRRQS